MARVANTIVNIIDNALEVYCQRCGDCHFRDVYGFGRLQQFITDEELDGNDLSIEEELGDKCNPHDCTYSWMADHQFPIPSYAILSNKQQTHLFIFYILQYCKKYENAPSDKYIKVQIIPIVGGSSTYEDNLEKKDEDIPGKHMYMNIGSQFNYIDILKNEIKEMKVQHEYDKQLLKSQISKLEEQMKQLKSDIYGKNKKINVGL
eukprot:533385_1